MKNRNIILFLGLLFIALFLLCVCGKAATNRRTDIYVVIYATCKGKTGHAGIAVDKYQIVYRDIKINGQLVQQEDTVKTGELIYFDLWPNDDYFNKIRTSKNIPGVYYKLPQKLFETITLNSLADAGIPHKENYPCDGLLRLKSAAGKDFELVSFLDSVMKANREFNARKFNCTDFVLLPLKRLLGIRIRSREFIPFTFSSTPNKLYRRLKKIHGVEVIKNADRETSRSFISQRIIYKIFNHTTT